MMMNDIEMLEAAEVKVEKQQTKERLNNPSLVFEQNLREIEETLNQVISRSGKSFDDFESFLKNDKPDLAKKIEEYEQRIDNHIYGKFRENRLTVKEYKRWLAALKKWKKAFIDGIRYYELKSFGHVLNNTIMAN